MREKNCFFHPLALVSVLTLLFGAILLGTCWKYFRLYSNFKKEFYKTHSSENFTSTTAANAQNHTGLVYDLINMDVTNRIVDDTVAQQARYKVTLYLDDVKDHCHTDHTDAGNEKFVACAGHTLAKHFYYRPGGAVAANYAADNSDCDANTYLMMTAATQAGIESWVVFAPSHAFFAWKDSFGNYRYWETTTDNNRGKWADFREPLYKKAISPAYYRPRDSRYATQFYQAIIYTDSREKTPLDTGLIPLLDNHFVSDILLYYKASAGKLTDKDVAFLRSGLQEDFTSTNRTGALAIYYLAHGNKSKAAAYLSRINSEDCQTSCVELLSETSPLKRFITYPYSWLDRFYDRHDAYLSLLAYYMLMSGVFLVLIGLATGLIWLYALVSAKKQTPENAIQSK